MQNIQSATVIIPTLNEESSIGALVSALLDLNYNVVVSDDGSTDSTRQIVSELVSKNHRVYFFDHSKYERGLARSILDAVQHCSNDIIVIMDADFQHPVNMIPSLVAALKNADVAVACRAQVSGWGYHRLLISACANLIARFVLLLRGSASCSDPISGFFAIKKSKIVSIDQKRVVGSGFKILFDVLKQYPRGNLIVTERSYKFFNRASGRSKFSSAQVLLFIRSLIC